MRSRVRFYVVLGVCALAPAPLALLSKANDWSKVEFYGAAALLLAVIVSAGLIWIEFAPDGAFRREPRT